MHEARPYLVCGACEGRLQSLSLRPQEWFNLAAIHGWAKYLLHDDFYNDDGTACQPAGEVSDAHLFPAPTLDQVRDDLPRLVDYCITRWHIGEATIAAVRRFPPETIFRELLGRVDEPVERSILATSYRLCARAIGPIAANWILDQAEHLPDLIFSWAEAAANCLPSDEGFGMVTAGLELCELRVLADSAQALVWFRTERTLDWIEQKLPDTGLPVVEQWGRLASVSRISWPRIQRWLFNGRPCSLVALDALNACWHYNTSILREMEPKLLEAARLDEAIRELEHYRTRDPVPRVKMTIPHIVAHWHEIVGTDPQSGRPR
jgi:hypothetical protein